ncbi:hypothetical protein IJG73_00880 [Candidatus Saccharibacteria bacterium]|nr:hypothetical protein [Candidatus Saccharibacteria bacterium]
MGGRLLALVKQIKTWQLFLVLLPLLFVTATLLRFDHLKMTDLKNAVLAADEAEDDAAILTALENLKKFTDTHIVVNIVEKNGRQNLTFGTGPFYLEHLYIRKATEEIAKAEQKLQETGDTNPNGNIFAAAMAVCKPQAIANRWSWNSPNYLNCMTGEINKYPATDDITDSLTADVPSTALYRYDYASPVWAPTAAGFCILLCFILIVVIFIRVLIWITLRIALIFLKNH